MKYAFLGFFLSFAAAAAPVKTCQTELPYLDKEGTLPTVVEVNQKNGKLTAKVTQRGVEGQSVVTNYSVKTLSTKVRAGLTGDLDRVDEDSLNKGELLVTHAMALESDPVFEGKFKSGVKLKQVRSVKVFVVGEETNMGSMSLVEAKDAKGKNLGTFVGGFLVSACK